MRNPDGITNKIPSNSSSNFTENASQIKSTA